MDEILRAEHIVKIYDNGVMANKDINFAAQKGEIHAICGENGAGKSTFMKMLYGIEQPSEGAIYVKGKEVHLTSSAKAIECSIGMVHQHFMLVPSLTVAENVVLGVEPQKGIRFDKKEAVRITEEIAEKYNLPVPTNEKVEDISVGMKQRVEIIKALLKGAEILILDEPTTVLTPQETDELFEELKHLRDEGHTEIMALCKMQLNDMSQWTIKFANAEGTGASRKTYSMPSRFAYVCMPDYNSVDKITQKIKKLLKATTSDDAEDSDGDDTKSETASPKAKTE